MRNADIPEGLEGEVMTPTALILAVLPYGIIQWLIVAIVIVGCIGIAIIAARQAGITVPPFFVKILWIVLCCVIAIMAIKFLATML